MKSINSGQTIISKIIPNSKSIIEENITALCSAPLLILNYCPFGSIIHGDGKYYDWVGFEKDPFQSLLKEHDLDNYIQNKWLLRDKILRLLDTKDNQSIIDE